MKDMHYGAREFLDTVFRKMPVEGILCNIRQCGSWTGNKAKNGTYGNIEEIMERYGTADVFSYTNDERRLWRKKYLPMEKETKAENIFDVLFEYAEYVLDVSNGIPVCRIEQVLNWNSIFSRLGQDIFTLAALCQNAIRYGASVNAFDWEAVVKTNDVKLNAILDRGLAENHYHLNGSTQTFDLSWICLMNHVVAIRKLKLHKEFKREIAVHTVIGNHGQSLSLVKKVMYASRIRSLLFQRILGMIELDDLRDGFQQFYDWETIEDCKYTVNALRALVGERFPQPAGRAKCLDYCISKSCYHVDVSSCNRALAGERNFLYSCLRAVRTRKFKDYEISLIYAYILLKNQFREEFIQINQIGGFDNFADYQDRKSSIFEEYAEYWVEAQRLGICSALRDDNVRMLEARIMPRKSAGELAKSIYSYDQFVSYAAENKQRMNYFYICHFPKLSKQDERETIRMKPRNYMTRENSKKMALAIKKYYQLYRGCCERVLGIDACSFEIGCRPEVFATEFRFLRTVDVTSAIVTEKRNEPDSYDWPIQRKKQGFGVTYHVGEDFLGLCDGLRAIDEAIQFIGLRCGDRIGHALALGTDASRYYELKKWVMHIRKQDLLDNYVWALNKSVEWGIEISPALREGMRTQARMLFGEIYQDNADEGRKYELDDYYHSWKLRGDHPLLYTRGKYEEFSGLSYERNYLLCMEQPGKKIKLLRQDENITNLVYLYHYNENVKKKGREIDVYEVCLEHIDLITKLQNKMIMMIAKAGIAIECNPTSNIRIGSFMQYEEHPITRFNNFHLNPTGKTPQIMVSINTDDLGVFNTSLCHEYAVLLEALRRQRHRDGNYNDEELYDYLDYVRENGFKMSFGRLPL